VKYQGFAGGGGSMTYANNIAVVPGTSYNLRVGATQMYSSLNNIPNPANSWFWNSNCTYNAKVIGGGGLAGSRSNYTGDSTATGKIGICGGYVYNIGRFESTAGGGGGGAAGYVASGGNGGYPRTGDGNLTGGDSTVFGTGNGGGGGAPGYIGAGPTQGGSTNNAGGGGGGVGIFGGTGVGGLGGTTFSTFGQGGSGGTNGTAACNTGTKRAGAGGTYGGGGGAGSSNYPGGAYLGNTGGGGFVRILWPGNTRSYPSTNTGNL
jgi:hypothetical protein